MAKNGTIAVKDQVSLYLDMWYFCPMKAEEWGLAHSTGIFDLIWFEYVYLSLVIQTHIVVQFTHIREKYVIVDNGLLPCWMQLYCDLLPRLWTFEVQEVRCSQMLYFALCCCLFCSSASVFAAIVTNISSTLVDNLALVSNSIKPSWSAYFWNKSTIHQISVCQ